MTKKQFIERNHNEVKRAGAFYAYMNEHGGRRPLSKEELSAWTARYNAKNKEKLGALYDEIKNAPHPENCTTCRHKRLARNVKHMHCDTLIPCLTNDNPVNMRNDNLWHEINGY